MEVSLLFFTITIIWESPPPSPPPLPSSTIHHWNCFFIEAQLSTSSALEISSFLSPIIIEPTTLVSPTLASPISSRCLFWRRSRWLDFLSPSWSLDLPAVNTQSSPPIGQSFSAGGFDLFLVDLHLHCYFCSRCDLGKNCDFQVLSFFLFGCPRVDTTPRIRWPKNRHHPQRPRATISFKSTDQVLVIG